MLSTQSNNTQWCRSVYRSLRAEDMRLFISKLRRFFWDFFIQGRLKLRKMKFWRIYFWRDRRFDLMMILIGCSQPCKMEVGLRPWSLDSACHKLSRRIHFFNSKPCNRSAGQAPKTNTTNLTAVSKKTKVGLFHLWVTVELPKLLTSLFYLINRINVLLGSRKWVSTSWDLTGVGYPVYLH